MFQHNLGTVILLALAKQSVCPLGTSGRGGVPERMETAVAEQGRGRRGLSSHGHLADRAGLDRYGSF